MARTTLLCSESSQNAAIQSSMTQMNTYFQSEAIKGLNILKKSDSKSEKEKKPKSKSLLKFHLSNKIILSKDSWKFSWKAFNLFVIQLQLNVKFHRSLASKICTNLTKIRKSSKCLQRKIRSECHLFHLKTYLILTLRQKYKQFLMKTFKTNLMTLSLRTW